MHLIGYWIESLLDDRYFPPQELVGELPAETKERVIAYLDQGSVFKVYRGFSWCRFGCNHEPMGSAELTDGKWVWPEGLSHYVRDHDVTLPDRFLRHVLKGGSRPPTRLPNHPPSDKLWREWCSATSSRQLQSALAVARANADVLARTLREAHCKEMEEEVGVSEARCLQYGCTGQALAGMSLCAIHASRLDAHDPGLMPYYEGLIEALKG